MLRNGKILKCLSRNFIAQKLFVLSVVIDSSFTTPIGVLSLFDTLFKKGCYDACLNIIPLEYYIQNQSVSLKSFADSQNVATENGNRVQQVLLQLLSYMVMMLLLLHKSQHL